MIRTVNSADVVNAERFERIGAPADAETAACLREDFAEWLADFFDLDPIKSSDLILATNEALANTAEFAYLSAAGPGTVDLRARYLPDDDKLTVTVADHGTWRAPEPSPAARTRGRGIPLMHALTDRTSIAATEDGTQVCMEWSGVQRTR